MKGLSFYQKLERIPILKIASVYAIGLFTAPALKLSPVWFQYLQYSLFLLTGITLCCYILKGKVFKYSYLIGYYMLVLLFALWQFWRNDPLYLRNHFSHFELDNYVVEITEEPKAKSGVIRFSAEVIGGYSPGRFIATTGKIMISLKSTAKSQFQFADRIWLEGKMVSVPPPLNPLEFDYKEHLERADIYHQIFLRTDSYTIIEKGTYQSADVTGMALETRRYFLKKMRNYFEKEEHFSIVAALIYGFRNNLDEDTIRAFTNTGTVHILSVSGMHVAVLFSFLSLVFRYIPWPLMLKWLPVAITFSVIWIYAFITGLDPPITRAAIMISFVLSAQYFKRNSSTLNALVAAATVILLCAPKAIMNVGFQLSFLAVLGMILFLPIFEKMIVAKNSVLRFFRDTVGISVAAQILTTPLTLYYFGQFPTYFLLANLLVDFPSTLAMYLGFVMTINPIDWLNEILGILLENLIRFMLYCLDSIDHLAFSTIKINIIDNGLLFLSYAAIFSFLYAYQWKDKKYHYLGLLCVTGIMIIDINQQMINKNMERFRVYNTRSELTIAYFKNRRAVIYSTFDSLNHKALQYACGREIQVLTTDDNIQFIPLNGKAIRNNYLIELPIGKVVVMEHFEDTLPQADLLVIRKNAIHKLSAAVHIISPKEVILDGSNSLKKSLQAEVILDSLRIKNYIIKDNFAYVWDKESL
ncbi:ComEC/Rec2 family competence protein [Sphingobacterium ginsenosidimutans]|uniref:ComEC/Rec2 family competence protein n=2 Tax=Sphingobacterium ginsenosidimutans TaxID=687845 RepID=A0ABP7ZRY4_9SPHI